MSIIAFLFTTKLGQGLMIGLFALSAFGAWTAHERHVGAQAALQKELAATQAESARRSDEIRQLQAEAAATVARLRQQERANVTLRLSLKQVAHREAVCLDADAVRVLNTIGQQTGSGTEGRSTAH